MFKIIFEKYFDAFEKHLNENNFSLALHDVDTPSFTTDTFGFCTSIAAVYSSKIEGEPIEPDSYIKHKYMGVKYKTSYTKRTDDLHKAYKFASENKLNTKTLLKAHALLSKNYLLKHQQGKVRFEIMTVQDEIGSILYVGTDPQNVQYEFEKLMDYIQYFLSADLTVAQCFYFASVIHLLFLKIHPFNDGNGRTSRLLEKWFLAQKLGEQAWYISSEKYYYKNLNDYYKNLQRLGFEYETLNYDRCLPFLLMLPSSLNA
jgi:Fic family protein